MFHPGDHVDAGQSRGLISLFSGNLVTDAAGMQHLAIPNRRMTGEVQHVADDVMRLHPAIGGAVISVTAKIRQVDTHLHQPVFDLHG